MQLAKENNLKIMPLIVNQDFDQNIFHTLLTSPTAQEKAISNMLALCDQYHLYGLQFDIENININDKDAFSHFFQLAAERLHQHHYSISIAVVPHASDLIYSAFNRWYTENWSGAYDYSTLGKSADFISLMSYDQHTSLTTPGPIAAVDWVEKTIQTILKYVPASKVSLGIPTYSGYWSTGIMDSSASGKAIYRSKERQLSYSKTMSLLTQFNQSPVWQNQWQSSYAMYSNHDKNEYLFIEDSRSFKVRAALAEHYHLRGISVWELGLEDPAIRDKNSAISPSP